MSAYTKTYDIKKLEERIADYERYCKELRGDIDYFALKGRSASGAKVYLADYEQRLVEARLEMNRLTSM